MLSPMAKGKYKKKQNYMGTMFAGGRGGGRVECYGNQIVMFP